MRFLFFLVVFIPLALIANLDSVKTVHNKFFTTVITPIHNVINPKVYADFKVEKRTDIKNFGVGIYLYDKTKHGKNLRRKKFRETIGFDVIKFPNLNPLVLIPSILMLCLFIVSPISLTQKLIRSIIGISILYLVLNFFFAHSFEQFYGGEKLKINSFWRFLVSIFGFDNQELISVVVIITWLGLVAPLVIKRNSSF